MKSRSKQCQLLLAEMKQRIVLLHERSSIPIRHDVLGVPHRTDDLIEVLRQPEFFPNGLGQLLPALRTGLESSSDPVVKGPQVWLGVDEESLPRVV